MKKSILAVAITGLLSVVASAQAATVSFTVARPVTLTDFSDTLAFGKFDTSLGTLTSIQFNLNGTVSGIGKAESLEDDPSSVTLNLASTITLQRPDASTIVVTNPLFSKSYALAAFDGDVDFSGPSSASTGLSTAMKSNSASSVSANDFALFSAQGGGLINLGLTASGQSFADGSGNIATSFVTSAGATATVTYNYAPVPEPETYAMMLTGIGLLAFARRRHVAKKNLG